MTIVLSYKGFEGIIHCSVPGSPYSGCVRSLPGCPEFRGATPQEALQDFRGCVDFHTARLEKGSRSKYQKPEML